MTALALAGAASGCDSDGSGPDPSTPLRVVLVSPNGAEGAAMIELLGAGEVSPATAGVTLFKRRSGDTLRVIALRAMGGEIVLRLEGDRPVAVPTATLLQVAGPDNALRGDLSEYRVRVER